MCVYIHVTIAGSWFELMIMLFSVYLRVEFNSASKLVLIKIETSEEFESMDTILHIRWSGNKHWTTHQTWQITNINRIHYILSQCNKELVLWISNMSDLWWWLLQVSSQTVFFISHVIHVNMFIVLKTWPFVLTFSSFHAVSDSPWDIKIHNPSNFSPPCIVLGTCRSWYSSSKDGAPAVSHVSWGRTEKNLNSRVVVSLLTVNWYHCD